MRLFAAIDLTAAAAASLTAALGDDRDAKLRWVPAEQWHLTLAFYGEVGELRAGELRTGLERVAARSSPFRVRLAGAGTFPRQPDRARVLWVGLDGEVDACRRLADRCAGAGRRARIAMEDRQFRPHLTVARARRGAVDVTALLEPLASYAGPSWEVSGFRLVCSHLGAQVRHETLAHYPLA